MWTVAYGYEIICVQNFKLYVMNLKCNEMKLCVKMNKSITGNTFRTDHCFGSYMLNIHFDRLSVEVRHEFFSKLFFIHCLVTTKSPLRMTAEVNSRSWRPTAFIVLSSCSYQKSLHFKTPLVLNNALSFPCVCLVANPKFMCDAPITPYYYITQPIVV